MSEPPVEKAPTYRAFTSCDIVAAHALSLAAGWPHGGQGTDGTIVPIDSAPQLEPSGAPLAELLLTPTPHCRNQTDHRSLDGKFTCGTWDSTPYHRLAMSYSHYELMHLLEGSVTFVDETGRPATFSRGDIFLVEQGARCSWESREHVAKVLPFIVWHKAVDRPLITPAG
ncbi:cupin domain-containing protein [Paraburkholderia guartelaensis]|uniref:cupin domain-containing protein n=1 Tax=Paraburkholderia guartelaensis TaxID=2546446 RepID=UPI001FE9E81D|nr:cupin domain-containing protein [Paraburkholderia guartelaensis]